MVFFQRLMIFVLVGALPLSTLSASDNKHQTTINIAAIDKEHIFNENGPVRQLLNNHISHYLPQYRLNYIETNFLAFWRNVQQGEPLCHVFARGHISNINTIRSKHATLLTPMPAVVIHNSALKKLENQTLSAESIIANKQLMGGYNTGRNYPVYVQQLIEEKITDRKSTLFGGHFSIHQLHKLTHQGQLDYFVGLPQIMPLISGITLDDFTIVPFAEQSPQPLYFICSDNDTHQQFLNDFDRTAFSWYHNQHFNTLWQFLYPEDKKSHFKQLNRFIDQQMRE
ncbi:hypothetical protein [Thalassotalea sediminis]|uniref:hypothetical protein n=1 Tax=Thalassotalea sediminis TaxID=1759089 RepID=UPI002574168A|nr:hypothetical protein [Thalassotalea sediminis]